MTAGIRQWPKRVLRFDRDALHLRSALLRAGAVMACLVVGILSGYPQAAFNAALGALLVGLLDQREAYVQRLESMTVGLMVMTPVVLLAGLVSGAPYWHVILGAGAAFACGLAAAWGPRLGTAAAIALAIFAAYAGTPVTTREAAWMAVAFAFGGLLQLGVCLTPWVLRRPGEVHVPISDAWRVIGHAAMPNGQSLMSPVLIGATHAALARAAQLPPGVPGTAELRQLAHEADAVRLRLGVAGPHRALDHPEGQGRTALSGDYVTAVGAACLAISGAVYRRRQVLRAQQAVADVHSVPTPSDPENRRERSLIERSLTIAVTASAALNRPGGISPVGHLPGAPIFTRPLRLGWKSPVIRQALRLTITFTVALLLGMVAFGQRSYWIAFTVALVTQPGFSGTIAKALSRIVGTLAGLMLVAAIVAVAPIQAGWFILIPGVAAIGIYALAPANYGLTVVFITAFALLPIEILGGTSDRPLFARAIDTLIGGGLVMIASMVAPDRAGPRLSQDLADVAEAMRIAVLTVVRGDAGPDVEAARQKMLLSRLQFAVTLDQAWMEPPGHGLDPGTAQEVIGNLNLVALYRGDLLDGLQDPLCGEADRTVEALAELAARLRSVTGRGVVPERSSGWRVPPMGPGTQAVAAAQLALDRADYRHSHG